MGQGQESILGAVTSTGEEIPDTEAHQMPVPEAESDDEYEAIPSRKGKQVAETQSEKPYNASSQTKAMTQKPELGSSDKPEEPEPEIMAEGDQETVGAAQKAAATTNDDDWLRSRTNRLLDLMDPDDLPQQRPDAPVTSLPNPIPDDRPKQNESVDEIVEGVTPTSPDQAATETEAVPDTLDLIRRTSRLFVRNLPYGATEDDIRDCFEKFGAIEEVCDISFGDVVTFLPRLGTPPNLPLFHFGYMMNPR